MNETKVKNMPFAAGILLIINLIFFTLSLINVSLMMGLFSLNTLNLIFNFIFTVFLVIVLFMKKKDNILCAAICLKYGLLALYNLLLIFSKIKFIVKEISDLSVFDFINGFSLIISQTITVAAALLMIFIGFYYKIKDDKLKKTVKKLWFAPAGLFLVFFILNQFISFIISIFAGYFSFIRNLAVPVLFIIFMGIIPAAAMAAAAAWIIFGKEPVLLNNYNQANQTAGYNPYNQNNQPPYGNI